MTWLGNSVTVVGCNDKRHKGEREFTVSHGAAVSAMSAIEQRGWGYRHADQAHQCPDCLARRVRAN